MLEFRNTFVSPASYDSVRFTFISSSEGFTSVVDNDGAGYPSIGIGFKLKDDNVRNWVLQEVTGNNVPTGLDTDIKNIVANGWVAGSGGTLDQINAKMAAAHISYANVPTTLTLNTTQANNIYQNIVGTYENRVNAKISGIDQSYERAALVSLAYNSANLIGPNLQTAINEGNRAEAWYEIRYQSNSPNQSQNILEGIAKRRYYESEMFSLYKDIHHVTDKEARDVYSMYERHQEYNSNNRISNYDNAYSKMIDTNIDIHGNPVNANHDYNKSILQAGEVQTLSESMSYAHDYLVNTYAHGQTIDHIFVDYIPEGGNSETNTYSGTSGNDLIFGGIGVNTLSGGEGNDIFVIDGTDNIVNGDTFNGGNGSDTVDYSSMLPIIGYWQHAGVIVDLVENKSYRNDGTGLTYFDNLVSIENIIGTDEGDGVITNSGNNYVDLRGGSFNWVASYGSGGSDTFVYHGNSGILQINDILHSEDIIKLDGITTSNLGYITTVNGYGATGFENGQYSPTVSIFQYSGLDVYQNFCIQTYSGVLNSTFTSIDFSNAVKFQNPDGSIVSLQSLTNLSYTNWQFKMGTNNSDNIIGDESNENINVGDGNDNVNGSVGNDIISGNFGDDILNGGTGDDTLHGGVGNDNAVYTFVENKTDTDIYYGDEGNDTLTLSFNSADLNSSIKLDIVNYRNFINTPSNIDLNSDAGSEYQFTSIGLKAGRFENLVVQIDGVTTPITVNGKDDNFTGAVNTVITGNVLSDNGNGADNGFLTTLQVTPGTFATNQGGSIVISSDGAISYTPGTGFIGADSFAYNVDDTHNTTNSAIAHFFVGVSSTVNGTTGNDTLTGTSANEVLIGGTGNDTITANDGNDILYGGAGNDTMSGGNGNDVYIVDSFSDSVSESASAGTDTVQSSITYTLTTNVENLLLDGAAAIGGTGNALNNTITGNIANNILDGGSGNDTLIGGKGNDTYIVDSTSDVITENASEGIDTISHRTPVDYTMPVNVENMTMDRPDNMNGWGNALDNAITGTAYMNNIYGNDGNDTLYGLAGNDNLTGGNGDDYLDGGAGIDSMIGGAGNDTMVVDSASDSLTENASEGTDTIISSITYTLATNFENLTLSGASNINATGNSVANILTGNTGNNTLDGGAGNDAMSGGAGNDIYIVDSISDTVTENANEGVDTVQSSVAFTLGTNVENLTLTGSSSVNGTGNTLDNYITGNTGANILTGGAGNDTLDGGTGTDTLVGGLGNDIYIVDVISDVVTENVNEGIDTVLSRTTVDYTLAANIENLTLDRADNMNGTGNSLDNIINGTAYVNVIYGLDGNDTIFGLAGNDTLYGGDGNDSLDGGSGIDSMTGGTGNDNYFIDSTSDSITENTNEGIDNVQSSVTYTLSANLENLQLIGTGNISGTGNTTDNILTGNSGNNTLDGNSGNDYIDGGAGADNLYGGTGDDVFIVDNTGDSVIENASAGTDIIYSSVSYTLSANVENLILTGIANINGTGNSLANVITGNDGNNTLDGGAGNDTLIGGKGNDIYIVDSSSDIVTENSNEGVDTVQTAITFTLSYANVENLTLTGSSAINGTGDGNDNYITGNSGANTLTGGGGNDTLDGGAGNDTLVGGTGNDTYIVDSVSDIITENANEGIDTVSHRTPNDYTMAANIENMTMDRPDNMNGWGNALDNVISGTAYMNNIYGMDGNDTLYGFAGNDNLTGGNGNDYLDGGAGIDSMIGGAGNDTMVVDSASDSLTENASEGTDTVISSITYTIATNFENLTLSGSSNINGTGNAANNIITGNSGGNTLDGQSGVDTLVGGAGNDTYIVDSTTDTITENANEGTDTVFSSVTYTILPTNVENITLTGSGNINATGNSANNIITGNSGANILSGGDGNDTLDGVSGIDTLVGGLGNDIFVVHSLSDVVTENSNEGVDTIRVDFASHYTLATNVENLTLNAVGDYNGTGNTLDNIIFGTGSNNSLYGLDGNDTLYGSGGTDSLYGGNGNDTLDGGQGNDTLTGGAGNDTYIIDSATDTVVENASEGIDSVQAIVTHTLASNVENLDLIGTAAINGTGNALDNIINGGSGANTLSGNDGLDKLNGGSGADTLTGGNGKDTFIFDQTALSASDVITDFKASTDNDVLTLKDLLTGFTPGTSAISDFVHLTQSGANMILSVDTDGTGSAHSFQDIATLTSTTGLNVDTLYGTGNILVV